MTEPRPFLSTRRGHAMILALVLIALWAGYVQFSRPAYELSISNGWVRLSPPNSMMTAGYGTFENTGTGQLAISHFTSPQFGDVTLHYTEDVDGKATMREAMDVTLDPGATLTLEPGGYHLMLMQRQSPTPEGSSVEVTITFKTGTTSTHFLTVERR